MKKLIHKFNKGSALIEFTLLFGIFGLLAVGSFDVARLYWVRSVLQDALGEGIKTAQSLDTNSNINDTYSLVSVQSVSAPSNRNLDLQKARETAVRAVLQAPLMEQVSKSVTFHNFKQDSVSTENPAVIPTQIAYLLPGTEDGHWMKPSATGRIKETITFDKSHPTARLEFVPASLTDSTERVPLELAARVDVPGILFSFTTDVKAKGYLPNKG